MDWKFASVMEESVKAHAAAADHDVLSLRALDSQQRGGSDRVGVRGRGSYQP
jgi:hypothetical protein